MHSSALAFLSLVGLVAASRNSRGLHAPGLGGLAESWRPAGEGDSRSPCPALNSLANEGLLPHDGLNITIATLNQTLQDALGLAPALASRLVSPLPAIVPEGGTFNLADLALHGFLEHDASIVHDDAPAGSKYASVLTNYTKVVEVALLSSDGKSLSERDFALARVNAEKLSPPLAAAVQQVADGETALVLDVFGVVDAETGALSFPLDDFLSVFGLNRFPFGFTKKDTPISPTVLAATTGRILAFKAAILKEESNSDATETST